MTCKDCIHIDVCNEHERLMLTVDNLYELMYQEGVEKSCKHFKNKADFVEVVRCKDCKFNVANMEKDPLNITDYSGDDIVCSYFMTDGLDPSDYCSQGKCTPIERGGET